MTNYFIKIEKLQFKIIITLPPTVRYYQYSCIDSKNELGKPHAHVTFYLVTDSEESFKQGNHLWKFKLHGWKLEFSVCFVL